MLHGILHNCGSFNRLIPLLKRDYHIVAFDLPGHGRSSHFPSGLPLEFSNFIFSIKKVIDYLEWNRFFLIGHSFGGQISTYFTALFPQYVELLIVIDSMEPRPIHLSDTLTHMQSIFNKFQETETKLSKGNPPVYSYEEAFKKVQYNSSWILTADATNDLIERTVKKYKNGFTFVLDQRLKCNLKPNFTFEQQKAILINITCPILFILSKQNMTRYDTYLKSIYEFNKAKENCTIVIVDGDHAVHQNYPERINHIIDEFINTKAIPSYLNCIKI
ncbi:hypothetical protein PGB90_010014 [Kerria lacca]